MAASADFFAARSPQAILKHGLLARYATYFAGRAGRAAGGQVVFIDGYAGSGRYDDGSPGSPLLLATQARRAEVFGRNVELVFAEPDEERREQLRRTLTVAGIAEPDIVAEPFEHALGGLLDRYSEHALLIFVDPFGLGISREALESLLRTARRQPVDVLYHFSLSTVARMARAAVTGSISSDEMARQLGTALGAVGWEQVFEVASGRGDPTQAALIVADRFGDAIERATSIKSTSIPVRQRPNQMPKYLLTLFSKDERAHWDFADQASSAYVDWLHHCSETDYTANLSRDQTAGLMTLFPDPPPERDSVDDLIRREAAEYLPVHLTELLGETGALRPVTAIREIYGDMLGRARAKHIRAAIQELHRRGDLRDDGKGDFWLRTLS